MANLSSLKEFNLKLEALKGSNAFQPMSLDFFHRSSSRKNLNRYIAEFDPKGLIEFYLKEVTTKDYQLNDILNELDEISILLDSLRQYFEEIDKMIHDMSNKPKHKDVAENFALSLLDVKRKLVEAVGVLQNDMESIQLYFSKEDSLPDSQDLAKKGAEFEETIAMFLNQYGAPNKGLWLLLSTELN